MDSPGSPNEQSVHLEECKRRIQELEQALSVAHAANSTRPHPLLEPLPLAFSTEATSTVDSADDTLADSFGTLTIEERSGRTHWFGSTAASEHFISSAEATVPEPKPPIDPSIATELIILGRTYATTPFEFASKTMRAELYRSKPATLEAAQAYADRYFLHATWLVSPLSKADFQTNILEKLYATPDFADVGFDQIALFFAVMAIGTLYDDEAKDSKKDAGKWVQLSCSGLALGRFQDVPTPRIIQTLVRAEPIFSRRVHGIDACSCRFYMRSAPKRRKRILVQQKCGRHWGWRFDWHTA